MEVNNDKNRKIGIDILKFIAAFAVVYIHFSIQGEFGEMLVSLQRWAVPIFFMITGFFYHQTVVNNKENKQICKILKLCIYANLLFFIYKIALTILKGENITLWLTETFSIKQIIKFILFNESPLAAHLWYLSAILYVLLIMKFVSKYNKYKLLYIVTPILLILDLIFGKYSLIFFNNEIPYIFVRNFLFVGIPYFTIGMYINNALKTKKYNNFTNNKTLLIILILIFCVTTILERTLLIHFNVNAIRDHYISTTFLAISLFIYFVYFENTTNNKILKIISEFGRKYCTNIYIFHPIIGSIFNKIFKGSMVYNYLVPFIVFGATLVFCIVFDKFIKFVKNKNIFIAK